MKKNNQQKNIPDGWREEVLKNFGVSVIDGDRGKNYPRNEELYSDGFCLFLTATNVSKDGFKFTENSFISQEKDLSMSKGKLTRGDLIITTRGTIGNIAFYSKDIPFEHIRINSGMAIIRNNNNNFKTEFLWSYLRSSKFLKEIKRVSFGSAQSQLTIQIIKKFSLLAPKKREEQQRIVKVLETWGEAITKLGRKIEIKKNIKKGLMQRLLTGDTRLPGFNKEWQIVKLGEIAEIKKGQDLSKEKLCSDGKYKSILYGEIYTTYDEVISDVVSSTNFDEGVKSKEGDVLIPASTTTSAMDLAIATTVLEKNVRLGGDINILRSKNNSFDGSFLAHYLTHSCNHELARLAQGITIVHLYGKDFKKIEINLPKIEEQIALAKVFSIAQKEIEILEKNLLLLKDQKKYLLNNLITGKIRTPETLSTTK